MKHRKCTVDSLNDIYKEIAEKADIETALKIHDLYSGMQIVFPKKLYSQSYIESMIRNDFAQGISFRELSRKYDYSERWIRKIVQSNKGE